MGWNRAGMIKRAYIWNKVMDSKSYGFFDVQKCVLQSLLYKTKLTWVFKYFHAPVSPLKAWLSWDRMNSTFRG